MVPSTLLSRVRATALRYARFAVLIITTAMLRRPDGEVALTDLGMHLAENGR